MRFQIERTDTEDFKLVDLHTGQIRYLGDWPGVKAASIKLNLEHQRKEIDNAASRQTELSVPNADRRR